MSGWYERRGKRLIDVVGATVSLVVLSPLMALVSLAVKGTSSGPVLYRQNRVGADQRTFTLLKFRSMPTGTPVVSSSEARALRPTAVGRLIRRSNVDELPQLVNIVRGDMSLVGPRPALLSQQDLLSRRTPMGAGRLRPGLTGLAQVNSYDGMTPGDKARWDEEYARTVTLLNDVRVVLATFRYLSNPPPQY